MYTRSPLSASTFEERSASWVQFYPLHDIPDTMHDFLSAHRGELIKGCRVRVTQRSAARVTSDELEQGLSLFLDLLIETVRVEQTAEPMEIS